MGSKTHRSDYQNGFDPHGWIAQPSVFLQELQMKTAVGCKPTTTNPMGYDTFSKNSYMTIRLAVVEYSKVEIQLVLFNLASLINRHERRRSTENDDKSRLMKQLHCYRFDFHFKIVLLSTKHTEG